jgi:hypothetical protein
MHLPFSLCVAVLTGLSRRTYQERQFRNCFSESLLNGSRNSDQAMAWTTWGLNSGSGKFFFLFPKKSTNFLPPPPPTSYSVCTEFFPLGIEQHGFVFEYLCLSSVEIKNGWIYASHALYAFVVYTGVRLLFVITCDLNKTTDTHQHIQVTYSVI